MHFKVYSRYFYSRLNPEEKQIYAQILDGWLNYHDRITVKVSSVQFNFAKVVDAVHDDNPELFYVDFMQIYTQHTLTNSKLSSTDVIASFRYSPEQTEAFKNRIAQVIQRVQRLCTPGADKYRVIHDYLVQTVTYAKDMDDPRRHAVDGPLLEGLAVCEGFARAFKLLCDGIGVPSIIVHGKGDNSKEVEPHSWNMVRWNNRNYHIDTTWDEGSGKEDGIQFYYLLPDDYISKNHTWDRSIYPVCTSADVLDSNFPMITGTRSFKDALLRAIKNKESCVGFRFNRTFDSGEHLVHVIKKIIESDPYAFGGFAYTLSYNKGLSAVKIWFRY